MKCNKCGYEWEYKGRLEHGTCPNCLTKVRKDE
jgi:predicted Zn-ribbon and HTH transcriptional regulator